MQIFSVGEGDAAKMLSGERHDRIYFQKGLLLCVENDLHFGAKLDSRTSDLLIIPVSDDSCLDEHIKNREGKKMNEFRKYLQVDLIIDLGGDERSNDKQKGGYSNSQIYYYLD